MSKLIKIENVFIDFIDHRTLKEFDVIIEKHVKLGSNLCLSTGVNIGIGVKIGDNTIIENNVIIDDECIIGDNNKINKNCKLETGVKLGNNVYVHQGLIIGEEAIVDNNVELKNTFYKKTAKSNITYCGNNKVSIGCQLFTIDFWLKNYQKIADKFNYTQQEVEECLQHMKYIKNNIK